MTAAGPRDAAAPRGPGRLTPQAGRLFTYAGLTLLGGVLSGRVEFVAFGAAAAALPTWRLLQPAPTLDAALTFSADRIVEGETVRATISLHAQQLHVQASLEYGASPGLGVALEAGGQPRATTIAIRAGETRDVALSLVARRWGVYSFGPVVVTWYSRGRLRCGTLVLPAETLRVLPRTEEFEASTSHPFTRALSGTHVARVTGTGIEPSGVREYRPGDALRHVNWRVTARRGALHVTEQRPERNAEVVLFLDTFVDRGPVGATTLDVAVRAAAGIAEHYLASMDRVGVVGFGGVMRWVMADAGRVQHHRIVEHLLGMGAVLTYASKDVSVIPARTLPPRALVVALSPLLDSRATGALADLARRGYGLVVVDTAPRPLMPPAPTWSRDLAQRVFLLERDMLVHRLAEIGAPVVPWEGPGTLDVVLTEIARLHARPRMALR